MDGFIESHEAVFHLIHTECSIVNFLLTYSLVNCPKNEPLIEFLARFVNHYYIIRFMHITLQQIAKSCNMQADKWKTTIDLLCLNREVGHAEAGKDNQIHMW